MKRIIKAVLNSNQGTSAVEMGLIAALIVLAMLSALRGFADSSIGVWNTVTEKSAAAVNKSTG